MRIFSKKITAVINGLNIKRLSLFFSIFVFLFILSYPVFFKKFFIKIISAKIDHPDRMYYLSVFSNLEKAALLCFFLFCVLYFLRRRILGFFYGLSENQLLISALATNFFLQLLIFIFIDTLPIADSLYYIQHAETLYTSGSYLSQKGFPTSFWPVGFPAYLAFLKIFFTDYLTAAKFINITFSSLFIIILLKTFSGEFTRKQTIIFLFSFIFYLNNLFSSNVMLTDYPFTILLWLAIFLLIKYNSGFYHLALIGLILGLTSYLRPVSLLLPGFIFLYFLMNSSVKPAMLKSFFIILIMLAVLSPWIYRNYIVFHKFIPVSTNGGFNFLMGNHKNSTGGLNFDFSYNFNNPDEPQEEKEAYFKAFKEITDSPIEAFLRLPKKIIFSYLRGDSSITWALKSTGNRISPLFLSTVFFAANLSFYLLILLSLLSFAKKVSFKNVRLKQLFGFVYIFTIIVILIYVGGERYTIPVLPVHFFYFSKFFV